MCQSASLDNCSVYRCKFDPILFMQFVGFVCLAMNSGTWFTSGFDRYFEYGQGFLEQTLQNYFLKYFVRAMVISIRLRWQKHIVQIS